MLKKGSIMLRAEDLESIDRALIEPWMGTGSPVATRVSPPELAGPDALVFASTAEQFAVALDKKAALIIASGKLPAPAQVPAGTRLFKSPHVQLAMSLLLPRFDRKKERFQQTPPIHPQSSVHPSSRLGKNVVVGPFAVIGANCVIGDEAIIGANCVVENGARIGARTILHPLVFVGADCELGTDCELHPHVTIGSDGFSYTRDKNGRNHKIPQLGKVVLGDRVELGAGCAIDRAAFTETRLESGLKMDNLCHVAHNVSIGEEGLLAGGFMVAGSTKIGKRAMAGGSVVVADHLTLTDDVVLAGRSSLTFDVDKPGAYGGFPLLPMKDYLKNLANLGQMTAFRKQLNRISKHLGLESE